MKLTAFSDYALRVLMFLALNPGKNSTTSGIAQAFEISENHLVKVVHYLARRGLITSSRGMGGGISLDQAPEAIRLGPIIRDIEGETDCAGCVSAKSGECKILPVCTLAPVLKNAFEAFYRGLDEMTLADILGQPQEQHRMCERLGIQSGCQQSPDATRST